jgi:protein phosphatase
MLQSTVAITCSNSACQAVNDANEQCCHKCGTAIPRRYLSLPDIEVSSYYPVGTLLADRYQLINEQIVLDTKPHQLPLFLQELDDESMRYAELFPFRHQIPQIYGFLQLEEQLLKLLEHIPVYPFNTTNLSGQRIDGMLMPKLAIAWNQGHTTQKLSWFYQLATLWQPLGRLGLTQSILDPDLVYANGDQIKLLKIAEDKTVNPSLRDFATTWQFLLRGEISTFWHDLFKQMIQGQIINSEQLLGLLDQQIHGIQYPSGSLNVELAMLTHRGPNRPENQDACHPSSESYIQTTLHKQPWIAVCDGIGGHEGGSIASQLAINTVKASLKDIDFDRLNSEQIVDALGQAIFAANDAICDRNDRENRQEKYRMGTTIVLAYIHASQLFLTHVGDSRAYRITSSGCEQVTVDDDLASRETIYGGTFYREALQYPGTGSLTQALGISASTQLQPTTQRFVLHEPAVFLLCSDGLSDFDRVDEFWQSNILPILIDHVSPYDVAQQLVDIANIHNGHDNVTVGLLYFEGQLDASTAIALSSTTQLQGPTLMALGSTSQPQSRAQSSPSPHHDEREHDRHRAAAILPPTQLATVPQSRLNYLKVILLGLLSIGVFGGAGFWAVRNNPGLFGLSPIPTIAPTLPPPQEINQVLRVDVNPAPLVLLPGPTTASDAEAPLGMLIPGTIVQIKGDLLDAERTNWMRLKVCTIPPDAAPSPSASPAPELAPKLLTTGVEGWQMASQVKAKVSIVNVPADQLGNCAEDKPPVPSPVAAPVTAPPTPAATESTPTETPSTGAPAEPPSVGAPSPATAPSP